MLPSKFADNDQGAPIEMLAYSLAGSNPVLQAQVINLVERKKQQEAQCTCMSELEYDAYGPGGPSSGQSFPPPCRIHPKQDGKAYLSQRR